MDTEIRTEVTLIYGWARQLGHDRRQAVVDTLPIRASYELISRNSQLYSEYLCVTGRVPERAKYSEMR